MNARTTGTVQTMTTNEIIQDLRDKAGVEGKTTLGNLLEQAADRLEELDERVAIMLEGNNIGEISVITAHGMYISIKK